jgi:hypothetical protein
MRIVEAAASWNHAMFGDDDCQALRAIFHFSSELIPVWQSTQLALGTRHLRDHRCVCYVLFQESTAALAAMMGCHSSLAPPGMAAALVTDGGGMAGCALYQWCRASLYIEVALTEEAVCKVSARMYYSRSIGCTTSHLVVARIHTCCSLAYPLAC